MAEKCRERFLAAMDDDFNTGGAIGELFELAKITNRYCEEQDLEGAGKDHAAAVATLDLLMETVKELASILGLFSHPVSVAGSSDDLIDKLMPLVIELRATARKSKNFAVADKIRDGVAAAGITLEDRAGGTEWTTAQLDPGESPRAKSEAIMQLLIQLRADARAAKDFATADAIRNGLTAAGVTLEDRTGGTEWTRAS